ncbi:cell surface protein SprA [Fibrobacter sp. UWB13]|nr:cell surface protein SprA [Fibrobacter sp. UWB13]
MGAFLFFYVIGGNFERPVFVFCTPLRFRKSLKSALWGFAASSIVAVGSVWSQDGTLSSYESLFDDELFQDVPAPKSTASVASSSSAPAPVSSATSSKPQSQPSVAVSSASAPASSAEAPKSSAIASSASKPASSAVAPKSSSSVAKSSSSSSVNVPSSSSVVKESLSSASVKSSTSVATAPKSETVTPPRTVSSAETPAESVSEESMDAWTPAIKYIPVPKSTSPLDGLLPMGGIGMRSGLMNTSKGQIFAHDIDVATREIDVTEKRVNTVSRTDTTVLWTSHYPELADYVSDMYDVGRKRLWLNGLVGQNDGGYEAPETGSVFDITIPVNMPAWMKDFGFNKPKLMLKGSMDVRFKGYGEKDNAEGSTKTSLWPSPSLDYNPSFMVEGKIGPYITVEIKNVDEGLGSQNEVRVVYEESFKGEFEDYILQRVEAGTTNLSLTGTEFTGYSENHQGLFGIKADWKLGDWKLTTIASQDGGEQEEYSIKANESTTEFQVTDKQFLAYRYYFLNQEARSKYVDAAILGRSVSNYKVTDLKLYKRSALNTSDNVIKNVNVVYTTPQGKTITKTVDRMVEIPSTEFTYDSRTGIVKINGVNRNTLVAANYSNESRKGKMLRDGGEAVLIQWDAVLSELTDIDKLMLRNVYSIGISDASANNFVLRMKNKSGISGSYLKTLGLADTTSGTPLINDATIFTKDASGSYTGEMWLPCKPLSEYSGANAAVRARANCLEPLRNLDSSATMAQLYTLPVYNLNRYTSQFYFESVGKRRNSMISVRDPNSSYSVNSGSCMDISPGSEKVTAGSTTLIRGTDYEVNYELGQIELLSERALDPNKEIKVKFECEPMFEVDNKLLLGARAELPLDLYGFGAGSVFGITALYRSQSTTAEVPTLGNEPYSSFLWGFNIRLQDSVQALTDLVNAIPGIQTTAASNWRVEAEFAGSRHNANTSKTQTALVEDFESTSTGLVYPLSRLSWYQASPPGGVASDNRTYIESQDYKHQGEFIWHSNNTELYKYIYPSVGNSDVDNQHLTVLKLTLRPNDNLMGNSWGGIMRPNSSYYQDMSELKYIEVVARGNSGSIFIDLGLISEDLSICGYAPNGEYNGENQLGMTTAQHDRGLDEKTGADETRMVWDCRVSPCRGAEYNSTNIDAATRDIARDDFKDLDEESDPPVNINGTENNLGERSYDTEDINRNGSLDKDISFVRYRIDLSNTEGDFEELRNGWRKWRIPLNQYDTIVSPTGNSYKEILAESQFTRLWLGRLNPGVAEAKVQIVSLGVLGNAWEENSVADLYRTTSSENSQIVEVNGVENRISESVVTRDTTYIKVSTINNRENAKTYYKSPNTVTERDADSNAPLKETALVLDYHNLTPGQEVGVTRLFETDTKNFSTYKSLKMEIHYENKAESKTEKVPVRFALQFGEGSIDGSKDFYEWSFRPVNLDLSSCDPSRQQDCHEQNWLDNAFAMNLTDFSDLKRGRHPPYLEPVVKKLDGNREEMLRLVGNPSITKVDWIRFVIIADSSASPNDLKGQFWINDLRLSEMDTEWGYAARVNGQVNFADFISLSGAVRYQDGDFATLSNSGRSPKPDPAQAASQLDVSADISIALNKFLNDSLGYHIPMSFGYHSSTKRPYMKPTDDMMLRKSSFVDLTGDMFQGDLAVDSDDEENRLRDNAESKGYESYEQDLSFSVSYHKDYKARESKLAEFFSQAFLERPALSYSYHQSEGRSTTSADSTYSYHTLIEYKLGTFSMFKFKPFEGLAKYSWLKDLSRTEFEPWPQTFDVTLFDFNYVRYVNQTRDPDFVEPQVDKVVTYTAELNHKLNMRWNILSFLSVNYAVNIRRDMFGGGDREGFTKENFFSFDEGGLFASGYIFDHDHSDRKVYVSRDSLVIIPTDTIAKTDANGKQLAIDMQNPDSYEIRYDTTSFYKVDSVGHREYGRAYGILRNERSRNQQFRINFNPKLIPFLPFNMQFSSDFNQQKTIPDDFDFFDPSNVEKNYWTISQTNRFEFTPTLKIIEIANLFGKDNAVSSALNKLKWREIKFNWNASTNTIGENFTLAQLYEEQGVTPFQYYLYGLGLGNGYRSRGLWNIMTGDMGLTDRDDFTGFAQYRNKNVDTLVYQGSFRNAVSRSLQISTGFTLPFWDISVSTDFQWKEDFAQSREYPLYIDTTTLLPKFGIGIAIPNIAQKVSLLNSFRSVSLNSRFDYSRSVTKRPFQSAEDSWAKVLNFNPLIRVSFLTQNNLRIENSVRLKIESTDRRPKQEVISNPCFPRDDDDECRDTTSYFLKTPWMHTSLYNDFAINVGDDISISYPLKLDKGFQLWKWYFKLKNDIDLKLTAGYDYKKTIRKEYEPVQGYDMMNKESGTDGVFVQWHYDSGVEPFVAYKPKLELNYRTVPSRTHEWFIRPSASYTFNKMASLSSYIEYRQIYEKLDDETAHMRQILQFELALMLRFD